MSSGSPALGWVAPDSRSFDHQLEQLASLWRGEGGVGPAPARGERPGLPIGGQTNAAFRRAAKYADGWTMGGGAPDAIGDYYAFLGDYAQQVVASAATDPGTVKGYLSAFEQAGVDEVICFPASADPAQVGLLAEVAL
jgi:alkanesulfonate monooxygenase SsuD/methylene tetrahydromethanopterin reductase-like flavin-dependent oxidoreductase (luciferase family)